MFKLPILLIFALFVATLHASPIDKAEKTLPQMPIGNRLEILTDSNPQTPVRVVAAHSSSPVRLHDGHHHSSFLRIGSGESHVELVLKFVKPRIVSPQIKTIIQFINEEEGGEIELELKQYNEVSGLCPKIGDDFVCSGTLVFPPIWLPSVMGSERSSLMNLDLYEDSPEGYGLLTSVAIKVKIV